MAIPQLYVRPEHRQFSRDREPALEAALRELVECTLVRDVDRARDLELGLDGVLLGGYRFTSLALKQVCALACPGLYQAITDLAGCGRGPDAERSDYSFQEAVRIFNRVMAVRFEGRFAARIRLLVNLRTKLIDGVLGPRYVLVDNAEIYERARAAASEGARPMVFHQATLTGRRLQLRFVEPGPLFQLPGAPPEVFQAGMHFANSEVGGESSVRAAILLVRARGGGAAMGSYLGGRRVHTGKDFVARLGTLFAAAAAVEFDPARLRGRMEQLRQQPLGLDADPDRRRDRLRTLGAILHEHHIGRTIAHRALLQCVHSGAAPVEPPYPAGEQMVRSRTVYDLYCALTSSGQVLYATAQEAIEQVAYAILSGRVRIPPPAN